MSHSGSIAFSSRAGPCRISGVSRRKCAAAAAAKPPVHVAEHARTQQPQPVLDVQSCCRRSVLLMGLSVAATQPLRAVDGAMASGTRLVGPSSSAWDLDAESFYSRWQYSRPADLLPYIYETATRGDASSVLRSIDAFSIRYPMYNIGPEKGAMLESLARQVQPQLVIEIGTFVGYSAIRLARCLAPGGKLVCVEASQDAVDTATEVLKFAGLWGNMSGDRSVVIEQGLSSDVLPVLASRHQGPAQLIFEDHCKPCYLPDLRTLEQIGMIDEGTLVVADNVVYPGAPDYLQYLRDPANGYASALVPARYEYDQKWNPSWEPKADAISVAVRGRAGVTDAAEMSQLALGLDAAVVQAQGSSASTASVYGTPPAEGLRDAVMKLQDMCKMMPNGKRCAPIPLLRVSSRM